MPRSKSDKNLDFKKYEELWKLMVSVGEIGEGNRKKLYKTAFIKGIYSGLGGVIGATIVLAVLLYVISLLGQVPFIGDIAQSIQETIENR